jgi:threonine aldolase
LATLLADRLPGSVDVDSVETNMVRVDFSRVGLSWPELSDRLDSAGIKASAPSGGAWRIVTHRDVDAADVDRLVTQLV